MAEQKSTMLKDNKTGITKIVFTDDLKPDEGDENDGTDTKP